MTKCDRPYDDQTVKKLDDTCDRLVGNAIDRPDWPAVILLWQGVPDLPPFEAYREELLPPHCARC